ncbi:protein of unknown function [Candidatus Hydrogenisulfobacillus filiaventi]|uniref:Uncharacterized protein n=1 Tax=Candidatus Hydrogenisulfobacillus filiaventi TaxID=2707344 RepID=A0A6F8ZIH6_9FIRM|nr:protein of unknown function [Candidatus Hydrogenisulfobacillus filiaventi]
MQNVYGAAPDECYVPIPVDHLQAVAEAAASKDLVVWLGYNGTLYLVRDRGGPDIPLGVILHLAAELGWDPAPITVSIVMNFDHTLVVVFPPDPGAVSAVARKYGTGFRASVPDEDGVYETMFPSPFGGVDGYENDPFGQWVQGDPWALHAPEGVLAFAKWVRDELLEPDAILEENQAEE